MASITQLHAFSKAVDLFNRQMYFECHDLLEELWLSAPRADKAFYQGILHIAVGVYHYSGNNFKGAFSQLGKAEERLKVYGSSYRGVDLTTLLDQARQVRVEAEQILAGRSAARQKLVYPFLQWKEDDFNL